MPTILIVGATGNIGASVILAARRRKYDVLAIVRNQASAEKMFANVGFREGITTVEADIMTEDGVQRVVDRVRRGELPAFQHVFSAAGGLYDFDPITSLTAAGLRKYMQQNVEPNVFAYTATIPYLLEQKDPTSSWTLIVGISGDNGALPACGMTQGALFSLSNVACLNNAETNVRFNELYLGLFVQAHPDAQATEYGVIKSSEFAAAYEQILARPDIKGCRIKVENKEDLTKLRASKKMA